MIKQNLIIKRGVWHLKLPPIHLEQRCIEISTGFKVKGHKIKLAGQLFELHPLWSEFVATHLYGEAMRMHPLLPRSEIDSCLSGIFERHPFKWAPWYIYDEVIIRHNIDVPLDAEIYRDELINVKVAEVISPREHVSRFNELIGSDKCRCFPCLDLYVQIQQAGSRILNIIIRHAEYKDKVRWFYHEHFPIEFRLTDEQEQKKLDDYFAKGAKYDGCVTVGLGVKIKQKHRIIKEGGKGPLKTLEQFAKFVDFSYLKGLKVITSRQCFEWLVSLLDANKKESTCKTYRKIVNSMLGKAVTEGIIKTNPMKKVKIKDVVAVQALPWEERENAMRDV